MRLYRRESSHLNGYVGDFRLFGIHDKRNLTHVRDNPSQEQRQEHLHHLSIRGNATLTFRVSALSDERRATILEYTLLPVLAFSKPERARCQSHLRTYILNLLNDCLDAHNCKGLSSTLYLVEVTELRLDDVEKQTRLLVERPRGDEQTPARRHRFPTRDRCSHLWVILVFVRHPVLTAHQHS